MISTFFRLLVTAVVLIFTTHQGFLFWQVAIENGLIFNAGGGAILVYAWPLLILIITISVLIWVWKA